MTSSATTPEPPAISVVIASVNGLPYPLACLRALDAQQGDIPVEVIVADCTGPATVAAIRELHPRARVLAFDDRRSVPWLRARGVEAARGRLVAVTEDHCVPRPDWLLAMRTAVERTGWAAVGGGVANGSPKRATDWAVFFCEYSSLVDPVDGGPSDHLPGMNVVYDMDQLAGMRDEFLAGHWENVLHDRIRDAGYGLGLDPAIVVAHAKWFTIPMFLSERFHYSRAFAGHRVEGEQLGARLKWAAATPALPPLLIARIMKHVQRRPAYRRRFLATLPLIALFSVVWAFGELVGYLFGPGDSILRIR
jgi:GT2 family glycosyltransferase